MQNGDTFKKPGGTNHAKTDLCQICTISPLPKNTSPIAPEEESTTCQLEPPFAVCRIFIVLFDPISPQPLVELNIWIDENRNPAIFFASIVVVGEIAIMRPINKEDNPNETVRFIESPYPQAVLLLNRRVMGCIGCKDLMHIKEQGCCSNLLLQCRRTMPLEGTHMKNALRWISILGLLPLIMSCGVSNTKVSNSSTSRIPLVVKRQTAGNTMSTPKLFILHLKKLALLGKVDNSNFISGKSTIDQVEKQWGKPDTVNQAGEGTYASYNEKKAAFGFNKAGIIFDVRSFSSQVQQLSQSDVRRALGNPTLITSLPGQENDIYQINQTYQLQFVINLPHHLVDHINVYDSEAVLPHTVVPPISIRGVIEGFYWSPWTNQERIDMFHFMKKVHLNTYVYAPKYDPYQRAWWGIPYPTAKLNQMKLLVTTANSDGVQFIYSISPGIPAPLPGQVLTRQMINQSITYSSPSDRRKLENKINQIASIGVHTFLLSFDDVEPMLKPVDQKLYGNSYAKAQIQLANQILQDERKRDPKFKLWFAPTTYYGLTDNPYWQTLRSTLNIDIPVIWTGQWVINKTITSQQAEVINRLYGRKPILWDNYPVNDYTYDINQLHQLMMGPLQGRDATLTGHLAGYISNPMLQEAASKLPLETIANYLQHPFAYHPLSAWNSAIQNMPGITNPALFKIFVQYTSASELNPAGYSPISAMISSYWNAITSSQKQLAEKALQAEFQMFANLPKKLPLSISDKELLTEIQPWLTKLGEEGKGGLDALIEMNQPSTEHRQVLYQLLQKINSSPYLIGSDIIGFMQKVLRK